MSELKHYGVKGMKWGVRRDIKRRSIMGARTEQLIGDNRRSIGKLSEKRAKRLVKGKDVRKIDKKISNLKNETKRSEKVYSKLIKDISPKDINKGRRVIEDRKIWGAAFQASTMANIAGVGVGSGGLVRRAQNNKARRYVNKNS